MPIDTALCSKIWNRYQFIRDNGHSDFLVKADKCDRFFVGDQWEQADKDRLATMRRPALTINKIISTMSNVMGEQIYNRSEISFRPRSGADEETAAILVKVFKQISDSNQLDWKRSDLFADGIIQSRGFLDVRMDFSRSMQGEVKIENLNSKNVMIDPDAEEADPDTWNDVITTKWVTADDIAILYGKEDAELLRNKTESYFPFGYDSIFAFRDRFGARLNPTYQGAWDESQVIRSVRMIERQHRTLFNQKHFVDPSTGDMRPIPDEFTRDHIAHIANMFGLQITKKLVHRIRWTTIADNVRLHDDWSPYSHFTVIPFFPHFRRGRTTGLVENLISPQELLNKVSSQELHIVNTTANSGWITKQGTLMNMSIEELEEKGAMTGLVIETRDDVEKDLKKIQPNQVPQGLDRIGMKAEDNIKTISGVPDSAMGFDREDVAAKAIQTKRQASNTSLAKPLDSLVRSDFWLARCILELVQNFYTEQRVMTITHDKLQGINETFTVNQITPTGEVLNDLTLGEYDVVVSSVPQRETLEDSQFDQALAMREQGVGIPDEVLIESSRLLNKKEILQKMQAAANSPQAQEQQRLQLEGMQAEVDKTKAETTSKGADAQLKHAKALKEHVTAEKEAGPEQVESNEPNQLEIAVAQAEHALEEKKFQLEQWKAQQDVRLKEQKIQADTQIAEKKAADDAILKRQQAVMAAQKPATQPA